MAVAILNSLELDINGILPENLITDTISVNNTSIHLHQASRGLYFADTVVMKRGSTAMIRGVDWEPASMDHRLSVELGREICNDIVILRKGNMPEITIKYQVLGGNGSYNTIGVNQEIDALVSQATAVDFNDITGIPGGVEVEDHYHIAGDIYDFSVVDEMVEEIHRSILINKKDHFANILDRVLMNPELIDDLSIQKDISTHQLMTYDAVLYYLSRLKLLSPISVDTDNTIWSSASVENIYIDTKDIDEGTSLKWELYTTDSTISLGSYFTSTSGYVNSNSDIVTVPITTLALPQELPFFYFYVGIKIDDAKDDFDAVTFRLGLTNQ